MLWQVYNILKVGSEFAIFCFFSLSRFELKNTGFAIFSTSKMTQLKSATEFTL